MTDVVRLHNGALVLQETVDALRISPGAVMHEAALPQKCRLCGDTMRHCIQLAKQEGRLCEQCYGQLLPRMLGA